jgi:acetyltransferase
LVREAYRSIEHSVRDKSGEGHFDGVTVQPMIRDDAYELILGSSIDSQLGPVILFGCGGQLVEVFRDRALGLPPLNSTLARRMMERTRIFRALQGVRGRKPVDLKALDELVVQFSQLVVEQRAIREIDINPLLASAGTLIALDARVVLQPAELRRKELPKLAIRPYPYQYIRTFTMKEGAKSPSAPSGRRMSR